MSKTMSIFLDALRFAAAVVVVLGHLSQPIFSNVWPDLTVFAIGSVAIFFVLSGFVISYVVTRREGTAFEYSVARISRLYSVLIPAVVLSTLVLFLGIWLRPAFMLTWVMQPDNHMLLRHHRVGIIAFRTLLPVTFLNIFHDRMANMFPPLDSPIWSLGYEGAYYALFGIAVFGRGLWRWILLPLMAVLVGWTILSFLPIWLAGVALQRLGQRWKPKPGAASYALGAACFAAILAAVLAWPKYHAWALRDHGHRMNTFLAGTGHTSMAFASYYFGVATIVAILGVMLLDKPIGSLLQPVEKPIRWFANHTFSLYLFHFPILALLAIVTKYNPSSQWQIIAIFFVAVILCIGLSTISEDKKLWWRKMVGIWLGSLVHSVQRLFGAKSASHSVAISGRS
jgi:peptidoglycan/LPS O-acetylase OafA/YrhL